MYDIGSNFTICTEDINDSYSILDDELDREITENDIENSIKKLKLGKSAGPDGIVPEVLKASLPISTSFLTAFCNYLFSNSIFPLEWAKSILVPIFKKGDPNSPDNYRGISLSSIVSKIYTAVLDHRLSEWIERNKVLLEEQAGFRKSYSCTDHIFTLSAMVQKQFSRNRKLYVAFVDFRKAFDLINRQALWKVLIKSGMHSDSNMFKTIKSIYNNVYSSVRCGKRGNSRYFECTIGVKQGCNVSPKLFSLFINELAKEVAKHGKHGIQLVQNQNEIKYYVVAQQDPLRWCKKCVCVCIE